MVKGVAMKDAEKALDDILNQLKQEVVMEIELEKVKNKTESMIAFEDMTVMNRANSLAYYELLGDAAWMNFELEKYHSVTTEDILQESRILFDENNSNTIYYYAN
jgi:predicted Zn-dependent peptidase